MFTYTWLITPALSWRIANRCTSGHSGVPTSHFGAFVTPPDAFGDDDNDVDDVDNEADDDNDDDDNDAASDATLAATSFLHCFL